MLPPLRNFGNAPLKDSNQEANKIERADDFKASLRFIVRRQPLGKELEKDAQVWEIYVQETDKLDGELVKEWNDNLNTMKFTRCLIDLCSLLTLFAALFSAITTALVLESAKQLQPDPVESSAQTLLAISHILVALSNGEKVQNATDPDVSSLGFSPSPIIIVVNTLWFLSLGLSVAVSLVAMLSKSWCNAFMANRNGPKYDQGRRRQRKWTGIESWGMESVFVYLPTLMHTALLLFAVGLALYLWKIDVRVASPIVALTVACVLLYAIATVLPLIHNDCPYSTPLSKPLARIPDIIASLSNEVPWVYIRDKYYILFERIKRQACVAYTSSYLKRFGTVVYSLSFMRRVQETLREVLKRRRTIDDLSNERGPEEVPMDQVTSNMLCWLVTHCEDKRYVDVALQSIAGACCGLPRGVLVEADAVGLIAHRLVDSFDFSNEGGIICVNIDSAVCYARALGWLTTIDAVYASSFDNWSAAKKDLYRLYKRIEVFESDRAFKRISSLWMSDNRAGVDCNVKALAASIIFPSCSGGNMVVDPEWKHYRLWSDMRMTSLAMDSTDTSRILELIQSHIDNAATLQDNELLALLESMHHTMIETMLGTTVEDQAHVITFLARILCAPACASIEFQHAIGLGLTIAAVLLTPYPGWIRPTNERVSFQARAAEVYSYHVSRRYEGSQELIVFGLLAMLRPPVADIFSFSDMRMIYHAMTKIEGWERMAPSIHTITSQQDTSKQISSVTIRYIQEATENENCLSDRVFVELLRSLCSGVDFSISEEDFNTGMHLFCNIQNRGLRKLCSQALQFDSRAARMFWNIDDTIDFDKLANPTLMARLLELSSGTEDVYVAPGVMGYLWNMIERLLREAELDGNAAAILAQILETEHFMSLRQKMPNLPVTPRNIYETGLADIWYPLLAEMSGDRSGAAALESSKIIYYMLGGCYGQGDMAPYLAELRDGRKWVDILEELRDKCASVLGPST
ncbi:transmembrane protein [Ceratobasidium sp. AG-Ba]|nr:transmembrane protein [Ceratobasidium sp. AG-Ba]